MIFPPATMEDCKCEKKCFVAVPESVRNEIRNAYQSLRTKNEQNLYLYGLIEKNRDRNDQCNSKSSFSYFVMVNGFRVNICQKAFMALHGITIAKLRTLKNRLIDGEVHPSEKTRQISKPKISSQTRTKIKEHILSILENEPVL